ncbi:LYR motif-containing protein 5A [Cotesia glomerata]|uniref:LYR motif-containing protein 5A n=1 Tax=Cotesia glomerata TaxID=32391 RepID=A0AAV7I2V5_COTGL|nr:LYR motif-containing protein 5A [Cotesia glomerata]KAH0539526.1 LYR motif-containing protein 5A [Cotesia glomerata]
MALRARVLELYKELLYMGKDYPQGYKFFRENLKKAFMKNKYETDPEKIEKMIDRGKYVMKEIESLYMLKKYRTMKRRYYEEPSSKQL